MANVGNYSQQIILNMINRGSPVTSPAGQYVAICSVSPAGGSPWTYGEPATASGYIRVAASWAAAVGPPYSAYNLSAMTFGAFSGNWNASGIGVLDSSGTIGIGNVLWYGTLATPRAITTGDSLIIAVSALTSLIA